MRDMEHLLTDEQMVQFIAKGYLVLHNKLPKSLHENVMKQIHYTFMEEGNPGNNILPRVPDIQKFFETPVVKGALTSVLGPDYYLHPHRHCHYNQPANQNPGGGNWHKDGYWNSVRSHRPWWAMIFYYTQDVTEELGPTAIMPGSQYNEKFLWQEQEALLPTGPAGTMVLVHFDIWHKASLNTSQMDRFMLKFQFARRRAPMAPSWNNKLCEMPLPTGISRTYMNLWLDVWNWLRGEQASTSAVGSSLGNGAKIAAGNNLANDENSLSSAGDLHVERERLVSQLNSEDAMTRAKAVETLGLLRETAQKAAPQVARLIEDSSEHVALNAAYALGKMGDDGVHELMTCLMSGANIAAQRAAYGLQAAGEAAVTGAVEALQHVDERRRALACFVLGMIGNANMQTVPALMSMLEDDSDWVRRNAIEALGLLTDPSPEVVSAIVNILETSVQKEETDSLESSREYPPNQGYIKNKIAYTAALTLLRIGRYGNPDEVLRGLVQAFDSKDRYVRAYAFEALAQLKTAEAVDVLIRYNRTARWCPDTNKASTF